MPTETARKERLETAILSETLSRDAIPIEVKEYTKVPENNEIKTWVNLMREQFAALNGVLFGQEGQGGFLPDIKTDLSGLKTDIHQIDEQLSTLVGVQIRDKADLEAKIALNKNDIDSLGDVARGTREDLVEHCKSFESSRRFKWEQLFGILGVLGMIAGILFGILK